MTVALQNYYQACGPYLLGSGAVVQAVCVLILLWGQEVRGQSKNSDPELHCRSDSSIKGLVFTLTPNFMRSASYALRYD